MLSRVSNPTEVGGAFLIVVVGIEVMIVGYLPVRMLRYEIIYRVGLYLTLLVLLGWGLLAAFGALLAVAQSAYLPGPGVPEEVPIAGIAVVSLANMIYLSREHGFALKAKGIQEKAKADLSG